MRPRLQTARDQLPTLLRRRAAVGAAELAEQLSVSVPTLHRLLAEHAEQVVATGKARRTRYAWRRALRGTLQPLPLYAVDATGRAQHAATLALVHPQGACMDLAGTGWPVPDTSRDGWWEGLPYPLVDVRPQGYLGRQLARAEHARWGVPVDPDAWSDDDIVWVLSRIGSDLGGNLILGEAAYGQWQAAKLAPPQVLGSRAVARAYPALAEQALAAGVPGSSAGGEFPKFPALRERAGSDTPHVLVKFSGADGSAAVQRWSDLLVCEHLALEAARALPEVAVARSRVLLHGGRSFLESERFDRHGLFGRSPLVSLATLDAALLGDGASDWVRLAARLQAIGLLDAADVQRVTHLWWFGRLIANSDMHAGNLSFRPVDGRLALAPAYDMLPMLYAPLTGGEVPPRQFEPPLPLPPQRSAWLAACAAALQFWTTAARDSRISSAFRTLCGANARRLEAVAVHV